MVPGAGGLLPPFLITSPKVSGVHAMAELTRHLAQCGQFQPTAPREGDDPATYLFRHFIRACPLPEGTRAWGGAEVWGSEASLRVCVVAPEPPVAHDFSVLKAALDRRSPHLFGALVAELAERLAPYAPLFTAGDTAAAVTLVHFDDDWHNDAANAFMESLEEAGHNPAEIDYPECEEVYAWLREQGEPTPEDALERCPRELYAAPRDWTQGTLFRGLEGCRDVPGIPELLELLVRLPVMPMKRDWADWEGGPTHPCASHLITLGGADDPVTEMHDELVRLLGHAYEEQCDLEPLHVAGIDSAAAWQETGGYLAGLGARRGEIARVLAALGRVGERE
ncbi:hypothetical protein [Deinococcus frigens]|uniref:hypothetical protein n=1 Tax=Deinococcus frigens TaxID=249403 RepID=UPI0005558095|nr:hypothetical protein [Deinococcus frigens]